MPFDPTNDAIFNTIPGAQPYENPNPIARRQAADQKRMELQRRIEAMGPEQRRQYTNNPDLIRQELAPYAGSLNPGEIEQLISHVRNLTSSDDAEKYFEGGPEILPPSALGPLTGAGYAEATRAPGTLSPWTDMQIANLRSDVASEKAGLSGQIQRQQQQAIEQSAMRGGVSSRRISRVPVLGQRQAMFGRQEIGRAGAMGEQALRVQDEEQRRRALAGATGLEQDVMGTQLRGWAGKKIGEAY